MRTAVIDRRQLESGRQRKTPPVPWEGGEQYVEITLPAGCQELPAAGRGRLDAVRATAVFDGHGLPDGFPFVIDDDGGLAGCWRLNQYLLDSFAQGAFEVASLRRFHRYHLARLLRFIRLERAGRQVVAGQSAEEWIRLNGEPKIDLTDATRSDLVAYRRSRERSIELSSLATEMGCISAFYRYAAAKSWMPANPVPYWGGRNMLIPRQAKIRHARFLTAPQTAHFLAAGLRGDGAPAAAAPGYPERDYVYGLLLATAGLRREECGLLLDHEVPPLWQLPADGVHVFNRTGKKDVTRAVYVTAEAALAADLYRQTERASIVEKAQPRLRRLRRDGRLLVADGVTTLRAEPAVILDGHVTPAVAVSNDDRARLVRLRDDGGLEPLGLFLARGGLPPVVPYWDELFAGARDRVHDLGGADRPPEHITVSPHTMRHTFAVRMLAALLREGQDRAGDPYYLLANPVLTVKELLGHADLATTFDYLYAAQIWNDEVPAALRKIAASTVGHASGEGVRP
jgi:integrase